jgi:hypothetical protein
MQLKRVIQGFAAVWLALFVFSFVSLALMDSDGPQSGPARAAAFLTWQLVAFVVAALGAFATRYAVSRGTEHVKVFGYAPLALSIFLVASFVVLIGFRTFVAPLFE